MSGSQLIPTNTFATQSGNIALSLLDTNFSQVASFLNNPNNYTNYLVDSGGANAYVVTFPTGVIPSSYTAGLTVVMKVANANTGASTLNVNSLGTKNILNPDASSLSSGQLASGSLVMVVYDGTQFILLGGSATNTSSQSYNGFKNRIINGAMVIDQRNAGASQTFTAGGALAYSVDRWYGYCTGANVTGQQVAGTYASSLSRYQFTGAASVTAIGFGQRIEQKNSFDLANTTATLSCYISNSLLTTVTWTAYYANSADSFGTLASPTRTQISTGTFTVTSTRTQYSTNISIPSAATTGIEIVFTVGAQTSGTWIIDSVQLEKGSTATSFDYRPYGTEFGLCLRYCYIISGNSKLIGTGYNRATTRCDFFTTLPVTMRASPTATVTSGTNYYYVDYSQSATNMNDFSVNITTTQNAIFLNSGLSGLTAGSGNSVLTQNASAFVSFSAEL